MLPHSIWWLVCDALAVYRLAILITKDEITAHTRHLILQRSQRMYLFVTCPWCISIWLAPPAVAATRLLPGAWQYAAFALALSGVAGFLAER